MRKAINRTTVQVGENKYRIYPKGGPLFYKKPDGTYDDIDHTFNDTTSSIGDISLMDKGVVSVGKRKGNNPHKVVGIRPDNNQHLGTQQLEFSLVNVELDGESQDFNVEDDLEIKLRASKVFQLVKINKEFKDFKIEFDIHAKGLELLNDKYSESTTIRDYGFNLNNLGEIDSSNTDFTLDNVFQEDSDIPYIDCCISKIKNEYITTGEYSIEEEFGDADLSAYTLNDNVYPNGTSIYYKDCIVLVAKTSNINNVEAIFTNQMCSKYGLSPIFEDNKNGQYFTKNNKKVAGYYANGNMFFMFINTREIPDNIKDLFKRKTFEDTSYLDITLSDFESDLNDMFNKNLKLELTTDYYKPIDQSFVFKISEENMSIGTPLLFDENYNLIDAETTHSLKDNEDGSYRYTKYFNTEGFLLNNTNIKYIDATLYVSQTRDFMIGYVFSSSTVQKKTSTNLNTVRNASAGTFNQFGSGQDGMFICGDFGQKTSGNAGDTYTWAIYQGFYHFDSNSIDTTVSSLSFHHHASYSTVGGSHNDVSVIVLKSTFDKDGTANDIFNDFTGHTSSWDSDDVTEYSSEYVVDGYEGTGSDYANYVDEEIPLNSDAKTDIENDTTFKVSIVEYDQFYLNSIDTSYGHTDTGERRMFSGQIDATDTSHRPYLEYTAASAGVTYNATFFGTNF